jgi:NAD(P)-dependent dehydrogenase (short-subunit alcohol dehydrogenase family)
VRGGAAVIASDIAETTGRATAERLGAAWLKLDVRKALAWIGAMARVLDSHGRLDMVASDECPTMTGSELHVDGGLMAGSAALPRP